MGVEVGDTFIVKLTVTDLLDGQVQGSSLTGCKYIVLPGDMSEILPREIAKGETVRVKGSRLTGTVRCVDGRDAWIGMPDGRHTTYLVSMLERA